MTQKTDFNSGVLRDIQCSLDDLILRLIAGIQSCWSLCSQAVWKCSTELNGRVSRVGARRLCWHNFEHNRYLKALSIMPA